MSKTYNILKGFTITFSDAETLNKQEPMSKVSKGVCEILRRYQRCNREPTSKEGRNLVNTIAKTFADWEDTTECIRKYIEFKQNEMSELKTTKEKVLEAAKTSPESDKALRALFPEVFEDEIDLRKLKIHREHLDGSEVRGISVFDLIASPDAGFKNQLCISVSYDGKSFVIDGDYEWVLEKTKHDYKLIPTLKK